jgi:4-nitrophenyl phosphatase
MEDFNVTMSLRDMSLFLVDLDGVVLKGRTPIPGAAEAIAMLRGAGARLMFPTNNTTRSRGALAALLKTAGIHVPLEDLITAAYCAAQYAVERGWTRVYLIGERGLHEECVAAGLTVVDEAAAACDGVLVGLDRAFTYAKLAAALRFLRCGAAFVATNTDSTLPTEAGEIPGAAAMVAGLEACSHEQPTIALGKPNTPLLEVAVARSGQPLDACCVVGDRPETDIAMARNAGCFSILVLTGVANMPSREAYPPHQRPDLILPTLLEVARQYTCLSPP